jgi:hypothetical protein
MNSIVLLGQFKGGDIEPGTFHTQNIQNTNLSGIENASKGKGGMPDVEDEDKDPDTRLGPEDGTCF